MDVLERIERGEIKVSMDSPYGEQGNLAELLILAKLGAATLKATEDKSNYYSPCASHIKDISQCSSDICAWYDFCRIRSAKE
jgi:hypothetical protein